jgi:hypothetical protein
LVVETISARLKISLPFFVIIIKKYGKVLANFKLKSDFSLADNQPQAIEKLTNSIMEYLYPLLLFLKSSKIWYNTLKREVAMQQIILNVEDSKAEIVLNIINNLKSDLVKNCTLHEIKENDTEFMKLSNPTLLKVWDNKEDSIYDKFLK